LSRPLVEKYFLNVQRCDRPINSKSQFAPSELGQCDLDFMLH